MIRFEKVTPNNWRQGLKVSEVQKMYVANDMQILARAYAFRDMRSNALFIYNGERPIGMVLYYDCDELSSYVFSELFIDERYQSQGFGRETVSKILELMKNDGKYDCVVLCYKTENTVARDLYSSFGFKHTGEQDKDEIIMKKKL